MTSYQKIETRNAPLKHPYVNVLRSRGCEVYSGDMRVKTKPTGSYFYPDVVVMYDKPVLKIMFLTPS